MNHQDMILLQCPLCKNYMAIGAKETRLSETILCPHCYRESGVNEVLNRRNWAKKSEQYLDEVNDFTQNIKEFDLNDKIGQLYNKYHVSPIVSAFIANCLLEEYPIEYFPQLFAKYDECEKLNLSTYIKDLEKAIDESQRLLPEISISAHTPEALVLAFQNRINKLEHNLEECLNAIDSSHRQIEELNQQLDDKLEEIGKLKDKIAFLEMQM